MNPHPFFSLLFLFSIYHIAICIFFSTHFMPLFFSGLLLNNFLEHTPHALPSPRQRTWHAHTCRLLLFKKGLTFLFILSPWGLIFGKISDSIIAVMGNRIKCELVGVRNLFRTPTLRLWRWETIGSNRYPITAIMKISEYFEEYRAEGPWF